MKALRVVLLLALTAAGAQAEGDEDFGPGAWECAVARSFDDSVSASSSEDEDRRCTCLRADPEASLLSSTKLDCAHKGFEAIVSDQKIPYHIRILDLSWNHIRFLEVGLFDRFRPLVALNFSHNGLIKIADHALAGLTALRVLNLSYNNLVALSEHHLVNLSALKELDLSWNDLYTLPSRLFKNISALDTLSLSGNIKIGLYIHDSPDALLDVLERGLRCLKLNYLKLTDLPANLFNLARDLEELHIAHNYFTKLPDIFVGSLKSLDISSTNISVLETGNFMYLPSLKILHINRMPNLSRIYEGTFVGLKNLEELYLEKCLNLTTFDGLAFGGPSYEIPPLHTLSLKNSGLQTLSKRLLPVFSDIENLKLGGNPWDCNCKLKWFKEINFTKEANHHIRCYFPQRLHNKTIAELNKSDFDCMTKRSRVLRGLMISLSIVFSLITLLVIVAYFDTLRRKFCLRRRSHRIRYDPMLVQLQPNNADNYWEENNSISITRDNRETFT